MRARSPNGACLPFILGQLKIGDTMSAAGSAAQSVNGVLQASPELAERSTELQGYLNGFIETMAQSRGRPISFPSIGIIWDAINPCTHMARSARQGSLLFQ